jgi:hypothetical protein
MSAEQKSQVTCPKCGYEMDVSSLLAHQVEEKLRNELSAEYQSKQARLDSQLAALASEKESMAQDIQKQVSAQVREKENALRKSLADDLKKETEDQLAALQEQLDAKSEQVKEYNKAKLEIANLKREKDEMRSAIEAESALKLNDELAREKEKLQKAADDAASLKVSEKEHIIEQLRKQLLEAQRKAEQGSMQLQGEVQELAIEEFLAAEYPLDTIEEIKKGARGADCLQIVHTRTQTHCGTIYYESKRTKDFSEGWIEKFKQDIREKNADVGVLVTQTMPADMPTMGIRDGVWVCSFEELKGLSRVLRHHLVTLSETRNAEENRGDKMNMLYSYLTGNEFKMQVEAIVEGFTQMEADLTKERRAMEKLWKQRQKQIDKVLENTIGMHASIKGIAGSSAPDIPLLELAADVDDDEEDDVDEE